jgi:signal peptidase I
MHSIICLMPFLKSIYAFFFDTVQTFILAGAIFLVLYAFILRPFQVSGESMYPTYKDHEYILTNIVGLRLGELKRGDVIVFKSPTDPDKDFIKRIMALPGDRISLRQGYVYVNGKTVNESTYLRDDVKTQQGAFLREGETATVPQDHVFVMGDNRKFSSDSREWGFLHEKDIIGKSFFVYWPLTATRVEKNPFNQ